MDGGVRLERGRGESSYSSCLLFPLALITLDHLVHHPPDRVRTHPPDRVRTHPLMLIPLMLPPVGSWAVWGGYRLHLERGMLGAVRRRSFEPAGPQQIRKCPPQQARPGRATGLESPERKPWCLL